MFPAEEVNGAGQKYHKLCLKCSTFSSHPPHCSLHISLSLVAACSTLLNSGNLNEHEKKIYCVPCYRRQFGPRGGEDLYTLRALDGSVCVCVCLVGRGLANSLSPAIDTPPSSPSLTRPETVVDSHRYPRTASTGSSPSRTSSDDDSRHSSSHTKSVTYLGGVTTHQNLPLTSSRPASSSINIINGSSFKMMSVAGTVCTRCAKTVYSAEEVKAIGKVCQNKHHLSRYLTRSSLLRSRFTSDATHALIAKEASTPVDTRNTKEKSTTTVSTWNDEVTGRCSRLCRLLPTHVWSEGNWINGKVEVDGPVQ